MSSLSRREDAGQERLPCDGPQEFDLATLSELFDGDRAAIADLLDAALASIRSDAAAIRAGVSENDRTAIVETAHRLKGTSGTIGAKRIIDLSVKLEASALGTPPGRPDLLADLDAAVAALEAAMADYRPSPPA